MEYTVEMLNKSLFLEVIKLEKPTRMSLLESTKQKMIADFESAKRDFPHYGERGTEVEQILIKWINDFIPKRFNSSGGFIIDDGDSISPQTDIIIFDALNSPILRYSDKSLILPADNVAIAIEVKSRLTKEGFVDAVQKTDKIKVLGKTPISDLDLLPPGARKIIQSQTMCILFAFECDVALDTVAGWYKEYFVNGRHIDGIYILNKGWATLAGKLFPDEPLAMIMSTEALAKPLGMPHPLDVFLVTHKDTDEILINFIRNILSYLQAFRNKMYIPFNGIFDSEPKEAEAFYLGSVNENMPKKKNVQLIQKKVFKKRRR